MTILQIYHKISILRVLRKLVRIRFQLPNRRRKS